MKFIIISAVYNMSEQLKHNIDMLKKQTYSNFEVYFGDDMSTDNSCEVITENIQYDPRFHLIKHTEKLFSMGNIYTSIKYAAPDPEDIIVLVDGDDCLADENVLTYLAETYRANNCWMTYGSYGTDISQKHQLCCAYHPLIAKFSLHRKVKWRASHLKTFKHALWTKIDINDLTITASEFKSVLNNLLVRGKVFSWFNLKNINHRDIVTSDQRFVRRCDDKTFTLPMLEMAGERAYFTDKVLYIYQPQDNILNFGSSDRKWAQRFIRTAVFLKKPYKKIKHL
ncbi:glycosyltransferase family 2 protein [Moritella yayanosii]|uniref:Glycosyltransferase 2-like domain-containing protein n=1 Tax=Moritella yayanosii TaxID=69539 RepID=A0A330LVV7_9GAMM|nr:glycosyltransferase family 2 protein [Moritella yayanosii]SQD80151.1 protein of unknown function, low identity with Glycosyl transferase [Moritella yayanosii]